MTRQWTEAETLRLKALARKRVSAEDVAKSLGRRAGSVKKKVRELGLIPFKKPKGKRNEPRLLKRHHQTHSTEAERLDADLKLSRRDAA